MKKEKESASFISTVGHTDKRVKLDSSISREDVRYKRALSAMAAKIAYENEAFVRDTVTNKWQVKNASRILNVNYKLVCVTVFVASIMHIHPIIVLYILIF